MQMIKLRCGHTGLTAGPKYNGVLRRRLRDDMGTHRHTGRRHVTTGAETGVTHLQAEEHQGQRATARSWKSLEQMLPCRLWREHDTADNLLSVFQPPDSESRDLCCSKRENRATTRDHVHTSPGGHRLHAPWAVAPTGAMWGRVSPWISTVPTVAVSKRNICQSQPCTCLLCDLTQITHPL